MDDLQYSKVSVKAPESKKDMNIQPNFNIYKVQVVCKLINNFLGKYASTTTNSQKKERV